MAEKPSLHEYLVISRGQWDKDLSAQQIQVAIDDFYAWHAQLVEQGKMKPGQRLSRDSKWVSRSGVTDGPFTEAKEVVGGYWFTLANSLEEAAEIASHNPCLACGLSYEIRPIESARASAYSVGNETPTPR
jgi:hypothetical protein